MKQEVSSNRLAGKLFTAVLIGAGITAATVLIVKRVRESNGSTLFDRCDRAASELDRRLRSIPYSVAS